VGKKDGVTSVTFMLRHIRIFSEFIVILWGQRSSRMGCDGDYDMIIIIMIMMLIMYGRKDRSDTRILLEDVFDRSGWGL